MNRIREYDRAMAATMPSQLDTLRRFLLLTIPLLLLLLAACAGGPGTAIGESDGASAPLPREASAEDILREVRDSRAEAVLVNVWATWCTPCRKEFPDLVRLHEEYGDEGFRLLLVSADFDTPVEEIRSFLTEQGVDFPSYVKAGDDSAFIDALDPSWTGALPASFLFDAGGTRRMSWEGLVTFEEVEAEIRKLTAPITAQARRPR